MNKLFILISIILVASIGYAQSTLSLDSISYSNIDFNKAVKLSKKSKKNIMIFFSIADNEECLRFEEDYMNKEAVIDLYNNQFINIRPVLDDKKGSVLVKEFNIKYFPCIVFTNSKRELIDKILGNVEVNEGVSISSNVIRKKETLKYYREIYNKDKKKGRISKDNTLKYANKLYNSGEDYNEVINTYFSHIEEEVLLDPINIDAIIRFTDDIYSREFIYLARNLRMVEPLRYSEYEKLYKVESLISEKCISAVRENPNLSIEDTLQILESFFNLYSFENIRLRVLMDFQREVLLNNTTYFKMLQEYTNMSISIMDAEYVNNTCIEIYESCEDKSLIDQALMWNNEIISRELRVEYLYTRMLLLLKLDKNEEADYIFNRVMKNEDGFSTNYWKEKFTKAMKVEEKN